MLKSLLQAKLHRVTVTASDLNYEGSCGIDEALLEASGILVNQYIEIYNVTNGERFATYAVSSPRDSGRICPNGASARKAMPGDLLIICAYSLYTEAEVRVHEPTIVLVDSWNRVRKVHHGQSEHDLRDAKFPASRASAEDDRARARPRAESARSPRSPTARARARGA